MPKLTTFTCTQCGTIRNPATNHWTLAYEAGLGALNRVLCPWNDAKADEQGIDHLCSQGCVIKYVAAWHAKHVLPPTKPFRTDLPKAQPTCGKGDQHE